MILAFSDSFVEPVSPVNKYNIRNYFSGTVFFKKCLRAKTTDPFVQPASQRRVISTVESYDF